MRGNQKKKEYNEMSLVWRSGMPAEKISYENLDCIRIEGIQVNGKHGATAAEREACLALKVDVAIMADLTTAAATDELADTINYSLIRNQVVGVVQSTSHKLLESLAAEIIDEIFTDKRIKQARVRIAKPERLNGATPSVELLRINQPKASTSPLDKILPA
jgi:7,8-dihydroneopterin aldolase/epimerase/oxygenase